jgi:hypothetical protein
MMAKFTDRLMECIEEDKYPEWMGGVYLGVLIVAIIIAGFLL